MSWRFFLQALPSLEWLDKDLPLVDAVVVEGENVPAAISGSLPLGYRNLRKEDGSLAIREWGCQIVAWQEGFDPIVAIVDGIDTSGDDLQIAAGGFTMYPTGMPWLGADYAGIDVDPLDMVRKIWSHLQAFADGYHGVTVDTLTTPVRIGEPEEDVNFTTGSGEEVSFTAGPFRLARWVTEDLGKVITDLADETPFKYRERSYWSGEETLSHRLELGYPTLGSRKYDLHFEIGMNVVVPPPIEEGDYASEVLMLGAGEGRKMVSALLSEPTGRLRRVAVRTDKSLRSVTRAKNAARPVLRQLTGEYSIDTLEVIDHDLAPYSTYDVSDEIRVFGDAGWIQMDRWVRIVEISTNCTTGRRTLKVEDA